MPVRSNKEMIVLMADDDEDDRLLVEGALVGLPIKLIYVENGLDLMDYLYCRGKYNAGGYPKPNLILLDLNMPKKNGREALKEIKSDPKLRSIPVVMLTTSSEENDISDCYQLGANTYIVKPMTFDGFKQTLNVFHMYWDETAVLPPS